MKLTVITYIFTSLFALACACQNRDRDKAAGIELMTKNLTDSSREITSSPVTDSNVITCILLNSDSIYCYQGIDVQKGTYYAITGKNSFRAYIQNNKNKLKDSLLVIIKPAWQSDYSAAVNILDEMAITGIKRYAMVKLSDIEKSFLKIDDFDFAPPEPVEIKTPSSVISQKLPDNNAFLIEIKKDNTVWYSILITGNDQSPVQVKKPVTENLSKVIATLKQKYADSNIQYLVKGDANSTYPVYEKIIAALKQNDILKYNLVTAQE